MQAGLGATVLLVLLRILQGLAVGGEFTGTMVGDSPLPMSCNEYQPARQQPSAVDARPLDTQAAVALARRCSWLSLHLHTARGYRGRLLSHRS